MNKKNLFITILLALSVITIFDVLLKKNTSFASIPDWKKNVYKGIEEYENGKYKESIETLNIVIPNIPKEQKNFLWEAHLYLGLSYYLLNQPEKTLSEFNNASRVKDKLPDATVHSPKIINMYKKASADKSIRKDDNQELVFIKGKCFQMGDTFSDGNDDEKPVHEVCVDDFYLGDHEVTQGEWKKIMDTNPSHFSNCGDDCPVEMVSWDDVQKYIKRLNKKTGLKYQLPTESQWEYAARSGGNKVKWVGESKDLAEYAWHNGNSDKKTHRVKTKKPNALGLYDMSGNVWEWVQDWYDPYSYKNSPRHEPKGPLSGTFKVGRGGSWSSNPLLLRTTFRNNLKLDNKQRFVGFRLARSK